MAIQSFLDHLGIVSVSLQVKITSPIHTGCTLVNLNPVTLQPIKILPTEKTTVSHCAYTFIVLYMKTNSQRTKYPNLLLFLWTGLSAAHTVHQLKHLAHHETQNTTKNNQDRWAVIILHSIRNGQQSSSKDQATGLLSSCGRAGPWHCSNQMLFKITMNPV